MQGVNSQPRSKLTLTERPTTYHKLPLQLLFLGALREGSKSVGESIGQRHPKPRPDFKSCSSVYAIITQPSSFSIYCRGLNKIKNKYVNKYVCVYVYIYIYIYLIYVYIYIYIYIFFFFFFLFFLCGGGGGGCLIIIVV